MTNNLLTGPTLNLRAVEPADVDLLLEWENDTSIWHVSNTLIPYSRFEIEEYVLNAKRDIFSARQLRLMIDLQIENNTIKTIGTIDLFDFDPMNLRAGIGIMIHEEFREKGHASEALEILIRYAFEVLQLHQLYCHISRENLVSIRIFEKLGFIRCGEKREWINTGDGWINEIMFQLIP
ncbi:MAG: GNAT family N-acetyltransferase [Bacteroidia bacterium]|nr:GNAT family N-acetyltransferase [Bacteroidia bacterium]